MPLPSSSAATLVSAVPCNCSAWSIAPRRVSTNPHSFGPRAAPSGEMVFGVSPEIGFVMWPLWERPQFALSIWRLVSLRPRWPCGSSSANCYVLLLSTSECPLTVESFPLPPAPQTHSAHKRAPHLTSQSFLQSGPLPDTQRSPSHPPRDFPARSAGSA